MAEDNLMLSGISFVFSLHIHEIDVLSASLEIGHINFCHFCVSASLYRTLSSFFCACFMP